MTPLQYRVLKQIIDLEHGTNHNSCGKRNSIACISNPEMVDVVNELYELSYVARYKCPSIGKVAHWITTHIGRLAFLSYQADD